MSFDDFMKSCFSVLKVIVGGDGSLTGANEFRMEWPELLEELVKEGDKNATPLKVLWLELCSDFWNEL